MVMEIRPAPLHRVGVGASSRGRLGLAVPVVALLLVAGAAWAGTAVRRAPIPEDAAPPSAATRIGVVARGPAAGRAAAAFGFPGLALGLPVRTGAELDADRARRAIAGELVVVAGILKSEPLPMNCPAIRLTLSRTFCLRLAALFAVSEPGLENATAGTAPPGPIVPGHLLPGTGIPPVLASATELEPPPTRYIPVVLAGRFEDPRAPACGTGQQWCREDFVVEQVVWVDGVWLGPEMVRDPAIAEPIDPAAASRAAAIAGPVPGRSRVILGQALVRPELLALMDPIAATAAANTHGGVWYIRSIATVQPGERPQVGWVVIDATTDVVLGYSWTQP
jgi:hypothetical protein